MNLTGIQQEVLQRINGKIIRGDIGAIAEKVGKSPKYVGMVLSPVTDSYNETIVNEAVRIIKDREQNTANNLKVLTAS